MFSVSDALNSTVLEATPQETWEALKSDPSTVLVDVRTIAEGDYIGLPVLDSLGKEVLKVEWMEFPEMTRNDDFAEELLSQFGDEDPSAVYFLCRSGRRSENAAKCLLSKIAGSDRNIKCVNVVEGFEGDHDEHKHRGTVNGWKVRGLPWCQP